MASSRTMALAMLIISSFFFSSYASSDDFLRCLSASIPNNLLLTQSSPSFASVLASFAKNLRFLTPATVSPLCIVTATNASHVQAAVVCGRRHDLRLRVRSGGHDYEGLSYRSAHADAAPFAVVDLAGLRSVRVTRGTPATACVDSGATLGELYHAIGKVSDLLAFPAGLCTTVGVGGHLSGGGFGMLMRRHGLAADQVVDALLVNAEGRILNNNAMGRDIFWAIRGGSGGGSFGIVLSWRVNLVAVPPKLTAFSVAKSVQEGAVDIITKWQEVAPALPNDLLVPVTPQWTTSLSGPSPGTPSATRPRPTTSDKPFLGIYGAQIFTSWLAKPNAGQMILDPYGGEMAGVSESETPFPHRGGVLYNVKYTNFWNGTDEEAARMGWVWDLYAFMQPHVSSNPREAYANYRDLWLGENAVGGNVTSFEAGRVWGEKYYKGNFRRLAMAKAQIDPNDYFRNEQSIPPFGNQLISTTVARVNRTD
ncbi:unnamed protein product [Alopecurus aequalis]